MSTRAPRAAKRPFPVHFGKVSGENRGKVGREGGGFSDASHCIYRIVRGAVVVGRTPWQALSCVVVVWRTPPPGGSVPRVFTERSEGPVVTLNFVSHDSEAVHSRGRGPGIHIKIQ